jgi:hypothetical protein
MTREAPAVCVASASGTSLAIVLGNHPNGMDNARDVPQDGQQDIEPKCSTDAYGKKNT